MAAIYSVDDTLNGFKITRVTELPALGGFAYEMEHIATGAQLLHLHTEDEENLFSICLRTPPPNDTGLPHILEHTVLCGSEKYPVKDPFVELLKCSMATFLNAMTYPDRTVYPCASMNEKDFFNLADVYADAVFKPKITEQHFKQEGHHFAFEGEGEDKKLIVKGIVYNEMKGVYSALDGIISREQGKLLYPETIYGLDYGGDPKSIPQLTYAEFKKFHETFYHPSNSRIFVYSRVHPEKITAFLQDKHLGGYTKINVDSSIPLQPKWTSPKSATVSYPIGSHEETECKTAYTLTFMTTEVTDPERVLAWRILDYYLLGNPASPLQKALIDSRLGEDLTESGFSEYERQTCFSVGLKGTEADRAGAIRELVFKTIRDEVERGLDEDKIAAAFHRLSLSSREIGSEYPLRLMERVYRSWVYEGDPLRYLRIADYLDELHATYAQNHAIFAQIMQQELLQNPHYVELTFLPVPAMSEREDAAFAEEMKKTLDGMSADEQKRIAVEDEELTLMQSTPNTPENLATLPRLSLSDVPKEPIELPTSSLTVSGQTLLKTDLLAGGMCYLHVAFNLSGLPNELYPYLALYCEALHQMGADGLDYARMAELEAAVTGGISASPGVVTTHIDTATPRPYLIVSTRALAENADKMLDILQKRLLKCDFTDKERLREIVQQNRIGMRDSLLQQGHLFAAQHAAASLSPACALSETVTGLSRIAMLDTLVKDYDKLADELIGKLQQIHSYAIRRGGTVASTIAPDDAFGKIESWLGGMLGGLGEAASALSFDVPQKPATAHGIAMPADVAYVACAMPAVSSTHPLAMALGLLMTQLSYGYLWEEVRVKRGAYGARASYAGPRGVFSFASYRDPVILPTLATYRGACDYIENEMPLSKDDLEQAIIGTVKGLDRPVRPATSAGIALSRYLAEETPAFRKELRQRLLSLTGDEIRRASAEVLRPGLKNPMVTVIASREKLEAASKEAGAPVFTITDL